MKADLAMAIHFHQPTGNFDHVIERACDKCYLPFLQMVKRYPKIKMTFHFTGCLLEWAEEKRPEIIDMIRELAEKDQIEIMSGGFYEPILPSIARGDRLAQIKMLTEYIKDKFSFEAKGAWVAERVWEPDLASVFNEAGIKYVILDDTHLLYSGIPREKTHGYYMTEDNTKSVAVFPSDKVLRYNIPFKMPEESIAYMKSGIEKTANPLFIYGDDGEKFGEWPGTHKWVFEEKWLEKFFTTLMENSKWLRTVKLSDCFEERPPLGRVYLPTASYEEMLAWALPEEAQEQFEAVLKELKASGKEEFFKPFIRGGFWRNFFAKYPESDYMNKRAAYVSRKLGEIRSSGKETSPLLAEAEKELFRSQCNCAYWHGVFGGLYLFHLRRAVYHHLIMSEVLMDKVRYGEKPFCEVTVLDIDADGASEVVLENGEIALVFDPAEGGALKEIDSKKVCHNLMNTLSRKKEAYHGKILDKIKKQMEEDADKVSTIHDDVRKVDNRIKDRLDYDKYGRHGLIDHFFGKDVDIDAFSRGVYDERGDFVSGHYDFKAEKSGKNVVLTMEREGKVSGVKVHVFKEVTLPKKGSSFQIKYVITNRNASPVNLIFAPEFNITMPDADSEKYTLTLGGKKKSYYLKDRVPDDISRTAKITDGERRLSVEIELSEEAVFWHLPVETVSQSEKAYELNYQASAILPKWELDLKGKEAKEFNIHLKFLQ